MSANRASATVHEDVDIVALKQAQRPSLAYFYLGSVLLMGFLLQASLGISWPALDSLQNTIGYKIGSGSLLAAYLWTQWQVPYLRLTKRPAVANRRLAEHKIIGVLGPLILYLHASKLGVGYTWLLTVLFLGNSALALLNRETLGIKTKWFALSWLALHVTLAIVVTALGVLHACTSLYYE